MLTRFKKSNIIVETMEKTMTAKEKRYQDKVANNLFFARQLDFLGINKRYMGFYMLVDIMQLLINEDIFVTSFSKQIYPIVAEKYNKTVWTVERNIRNIIDKCWCKDLMIKLNVYRIEKPCCQDFIYMVKNYILKQII